MEQTNQRVKRFAVTVSALARPENLHSVCHMRWQGEPLPSQRAVAEIVDLCRALIFPGFFGEGEVSRFNVEYHTGIRCER